jgi:hypothetical protein
MKLEVRRQKIYKNCLFVGGFIFLHCSITFEDFLAISAKEIWLTKHLIVAKEKV